MNADWIGAAYEFHDPLLQANFAELRKIAGGFGGLILERIHAMDSNAKMGWPKTLRIHVADGLRGARPHAAHHVERELSPPPGIST
jgi:hypothetical protein